MMNYGVFKHWNGKSLATIKRDIFIEVFFYFDAEQAMVCRSLGICSRTFYNLIDKYGLNVFSRGMYRKGKSQDDLYSPTLKQILRAFPDGNRLLEKKKEAFLQLMKERKELTRKDKI